VAPPRGHAQGRQGEAAEPARHRRPSSCPARGVIPALVERFQYSGWCFLLVGVVANQRRSSRQRFLTGTGLTCQSRQSQASFLLLHTGRRGACSTSWAASGRRRAYPPLPGEFRQLQETAQQLSEGAWGLDKSRLAAGFGGCSRRAGSAKPGVPPFGERAKRQSGVAAGRCRDRRLWPRTWTKGTRPAGRGPIDGLPRGPCSSTGAPKAVRQPLRFQPAISSYFPVHRSGSRLSVRSCYESDAGGVLHESLRAIGQRGQLSS